MYAYLSDVTVERSTLYGNSAVGIGGGARLQLGSTTIRNSTISGNTSGSSGGAIYRFSGTTHIVLSTITNNNAADGSGGVYAPYYYAPHIDVKGSIIWGNTTNGTTAADVGGYADAYFSMGHNLIGAGSVISRFNADGDQTAVTNALLGALQLNAPGTTKTHALLAGSPAINAGICTDYDGDVISRDQRGVTRPLGAGCDIGAYELLVPGEGVGSLANAVQALGPGGSATLNKGQTNALLVTLDVVQKKLAGGQKVVALNNLHAFIDKVETFIADQVLTSEEGQPLITAAEHIIGAIEAM
ncbi:MAG: hypothetical protein FIB01_08025 [Gemmatimonadetes bacterium]|nr:hypothetical protein [Gemmatimonadota bacterium]